MSTGDGAPAGDADQAARAARAAAELQAAVRGRVEAGAALAPFTSFRLGGPAGVLVEAAEEADLVAAGSIAARFALPLLALGRGSNVLICDEGFPGVVVHLGSGFEWMRSEGDGVEGGGAAALPRLANLAAGRALSGLEFAVAIPASLGGAVRMNAGAHQRCVSDVLEWARVYRLGTPGVTVAGPEDLGMAYRCTRLDDSDIVCAARLRLTRAPKDTIRARMQAYREHRSATQPAQARNAGSMFRNPPAPLPSAGALIQQAGLKGFAVGQAEVSAKHANFFTARPGATARDVYRLLVAVQAAVADANGVVLVPEVRLVGSFGEPGLLAPAGGAGAA